MAEFTVKVKENNNISIIELSGYLDAHTAPDLEKTFDELINNNKFKVIVNFENLNYISSAGLGVFMAYIETMRENNGDIKFCCLKAEVYNIFNLLGFPVLYDFFDSLTEAVKKFNAG